VPWGRGGRSLSKVKQGRSELSRSRPSVYKEDLGRGENEEPEVAMLLNLNALYVLSATPEAEGAPWVKKKEKDWRQ